MTKESARRARRRHSRGKVCRGPAALGGMPDAPEQGGSPRSAKFGSKGFRCREDVCPPFDDCYSAPLPRRAHAPVWVMLGNGGLAGETRVEEPPQTVCSPHVNDGGRLLSTPVSPVSLTHHPYRNGRPTLPGIMPAPFRSSLRGCATRRSCSPRRSSRNRPPGNRGQ